MKAIALVFLGGGFGSVCRFLISYFSIKAFKLGLPLGTLLSNVISCVIVALLIANFHAKGDLPNELRLLLILGFCGGLSTFSTYSFETIELYRSGAYVWAIGNVVINLILGLVAFSIFLPKNN